MLCLWVRITAGIGNLLESCDFFRISGENKQKRKRRSTIIFFSTSCKHFVRFDAFLRRFGPFWVVLSENCYGISRKIFQKNTVPNGKTGKAKRPGATGNSRLGQPDGKPATREEASVIFLAWRTLCAEITSAHVEGHSTNTEAAFKRLVRMLHSRVEAFGAKWRRWYLRQQCGIGKVVPRDKREKKLMVCASDATYEINSELVKALGETGTNRRTRRHR
jgi:hypothetical protein